MKYRTICENHLFSKVYKAGKRASKGCLTVYRLTDRKAALLKRRNPLKEKYNRIGITVSKKLGNAVFRSRAKRIIREALRQTERETPLKKGNLLVFVARTSIAGKKTGDVKQDMERCFRELVLFLPACAASTVCTAESGKETGKTAENGAKNRVNPV